ncbi:hypothetical protein Y032_0883g2847 [Ancylostoma ceylanicum]|uniref:Uncharacterized protein n=1 Tax=Ancylostoma ceylanicum TaxID=53326 RepID=A0A016WAC6_9BILA|nr:hypothetical protein Y032_0883g2847 [Ancylostoma ceylanicum]
MRMLTRCCGPTRLDKVPNEEVRRRMQTALVQEKEFAGVLATFLSVETSFSSFGFFHKLQKCCKTMPKTEFADKTAGRKGSGIDFFRSVHNG